MNGLRERAERYLKVRWEKRILLAKENRLELLGHQIAVSTAAPQRLTALCLPCHVHSLRYYESSAHVPLSHRSSLPPASCYLLSASHGLSYCRFRSRLSCWSISQERTFSRTSSMTCLIQSSWDAVCLCRSEAPSPKTTRSMQR